MKYFESRTQYSHDFNDIWASCPDAKKGMMCPYFAIITAYRFFRNGANDKDAYELALLAGVTYSAFSGTKGELTFNEVLAQTSLKVSDVMATTAELVAGGILGFPEMLPAEKPTDNKKHATIFLKNAKYFVVLVDKNGYYVRDCHESTQYDFDSFLELVNHMSSVYQFTETINITGVTYSDYSSIEFIRLNEAFATDMLAIVGLEDIQKSLHKLPVEGTTGYIDLDDTIPLHVDKGEESIFDLPKPTITFTPSDEMVDFE